MREHELHQTATTQKIKFSVRRATTDFASHQWINCTSKLYDGFTSVCQRVEFASAQWVVFLVVFLDLTRYSYAKQRISAGVSAVAGRTTEYLIHRQGDPTEIADAQCNNRSTLGILIQSATHKTHFWGTPTPQRDMCANRNWHVDLQCYTSWREDTASSTILARIRVKMWGLSRSNSKCWTKRKRVDHNCGHHKRNHYLVRLTPVIFLPEVKLNPSTDEF